METKQSFRLKKFINNRFSFAFNNLLFIYHGKNGLKIKKQEYRKCFVLRLNVLKFIKLWSLENKEKIVQIVWHVKK